MKILETRTAPNPRRVRIFLAEKGISVPLEEMDMMKGALKTPEFTKLNKFQRVPVLILDDGTSIAETMAICRYFEETNPEPALFGKGAKQRALVEMWNRRMELGLLFSVAQAFRHLHPAAAAARGAAGRRMGRGQQAQGAGGPAVHGRGAGQAALCCRGRLLRRGYYRARGRRFCESGPDPASRGAKNLDRWHQEVSARPSAKA